MRGQHYRARDKTVRKMGRDGLTEENLRSGETVRISRREVDDLALPGTADDSMNFQERRGRRAKDRKAGDRRRNGFSPDFKRPDCREDDSTQAGLYRTDGEKADSFTEDTIPSDVYRENVQETCPNTEIIPETDSGIKEAGTGLRETGSRQIPSASPKRNSRRKKNYIPEPLAACYRRNGKNAVQGKESHSGTGFPDRTWENASGTETDTAAESTPASGNADMGTSEDMQANPSHKENIREKPVMSRKISGTDTAPGRDVSHGRKKQQVYAYARKEKEKKKVQEGKESATRREEARHTGNRTSAGEALQISPKDAEKKGGSGRLHQEQKEKASRLSFGEEGGMARGAGMRLAGRAAWKAAGLAATALSDDGADRKQEDMGEKALHGAKQTGERAARLAVRGSSRRMQKWNRRAGEEMPGAGKEKLRKFYQKQRIKKAYAKAKRGEKTAEGAAKVAGTFLGRAKSIAAEVFRKKKGLLIGAVFLLLVFLFFSAGLSSCSAMVQGASSTFIGTTYPSEDGDIYAAEEAYKELEKALDEQINAMEATHPGYDEYRYQVDEIAHSPYQLISFLTVIYEEFTYGQVRDILPELFAEQYRLTVEEMTETRTRTETRTVTDPLTGEETETEVEYEWHVLCICLTNKGFDTVVRGRMTQEQTELYAAYNLAYGNRSYLFDITGIPSDNASGAGYEIPEEALSDEQFARMIREAEKYLGRAYVWGGASPETGFDCSGFVSWVINNSGNGWNVGRQTAEGLRGSCAAVPASEARPGDLVFFQGTYNTSGASHVGIYVGNGMMIHAGNPVKYSNIRTPYWEGHLLSYGRIR